MICRFAHIYTEADKIKIRIDSLRKSRDYNFFSVLPSGLCEDVLIEYRHMSGRVLRSEINSKDIPIEEVVILEGKTKAKYIRYSVIYQLPVTPSYAYNFLMVLGKKIAYDTTFIEKPLDIFFNTIASIEELMNRPHPGVPIINQLIEHISKKNVPAYRPAVEAIKKLYAHATRANIRLYDLDDETRLRVLTNGQFILLLDEKVSQEDKLKILLETARNLIKVNLKTELEYLLNTINYLARMKFFAPFLGKINDEGALYTTASVEWKLLQSARLTLRSDGRLSIKNIKHNPTYHKYYSRDWADHFAIERDFKHLANVLDLKFAPCDFHEEMIFTEESTQKLKARGLHFSIDYVKKLLQAKNWWILFNQGFKSKQSFFYHLPLDVINLVHEQTAFRPDVIVDNSDLVKVGFWGRRQATQLTMTETATINEEITVSDTARKCGV